MPKFKEEKRSGLMGTELVFTECTLDGLPRPLDEDPFQVIGDQSGVHFKGRSTDWCNLEDLELFAQALTKAWEFHGKLINIARKRIILADHH